MCDDAGEVVVHRHQGRVLEHVRDRLVGVDHRVAGVVGPDDVAQSRHVVARDESRYRRTAEQPGDRRQHRRECFPHASLTPFGQRTRRIVGRLDVAREQLGDHSPISPLRLIRRDSIPAMCF